MLLIALKDKLQLVISNFKTLRCGHKQILIYLTTLLVFINFYRKINAGDAGHIILIRLFIRLTLVMLNLTKD